jgi:hypothetical protein
VTDTTPFRDLLADQIEAALDAARANELVGQEELADWWRWRAEDLGRFLTDSHGHDSVDVQGADRAPAIGGSMGHDTEKHAA